MTGRRWCGWLRGLACGAVVLLSLENIEIASAASGASGVLNAITRLQGYETRRESSSHPDLNQNGDARPIPPGETLVLGDLEGPGVITHIWTTVGSLDPFNGQSLVLRIYWDGAEKPSVEAPLGDFFGVGHGALSSFESIPVSVSSRGRARNCFWQMPFRKHARITVTNESPVYRTGSFYYYLDWQKHDALPEDIVYFHARYRQQMPAQPGDYTLLETEGRGHYVGTVLSVQQVELGWFGEGDDRFYIDGEETPSLRGTGTEDYFGDAWGFRQFSRPYYGVSLWEGYFPGDRVTAYRWHLEDPVTFRKSLKVSIEHRGSVFTDQAEHLGQFIERPDWISSVAYWYQAPPATFAERIPPADQRIAPYKVIAATDLTIRAEPADHLTKEAPGLRFLPGTPDAFIEMDFQAAKAGRYRIAAFMNHSVMGGRYQPLLDGRPQGPELDFCYSGDDWLWVDMDLADLAAGKHTLRFKGRGASSKRRTLAPPANSFGIVYLILLRLEDMEGYHRVLNERLKR